MGNALTRSNPKLFARAVRLKPAGLFGEWEHCCSPRPMNAPLPAEVPPFLPHARAAE